MVLPGVPLLAALLVAAPDGCPEELFRIARSTNANVVLYEVDATAAGRTGGPDPVRATWLMLAQDGRREALSSFERMFAYGFEVRRSPSGLRLALRADPSREIEIREHRGCLRAFRRIAGREALLQLIYVEVRGSGLAASLRSISMLGIDPTTGAELRERIAAPAEPPDTSAGG